LEKQHLVNSFNMMCFYQWKININLLNLRKHYRSIELDDFIFLLLITYTDNINKFRLRIIKLLDTKGFMLRSIHDFDKKKNKGLLGDHIIGMLANDDFDIETDKRIKMIEEEGKESDVKVDSNKVYHLYDVDEGVETNDNDAKNRESINVDELSDSIINEIDEIFKDKQVDKECEADKVSIIEKCEKPSHDKPEKPVEESNKMEEDPVMADDERDNEHDKVDDKVDDGSCSFEK